MDNKNCVEIFGSMLTLLTLSIEKQLALVGNIPKQGNPGVRNFKNNNAAALLDTLHTYYNYWWDEYEPNCKFAEELFDFVINSEIEASLEVFTEGEDWKKLRKLAKLALGEASYKKVELTSIIDFSKYIEVAD